MADDIKPRLRVPTTAKKGEVIEVKTLITHPATTTHYAISPEERVAGGITDATLRLSVGIEHVDDLIADLRQALNAI